MGSQLDVELASPHNTIRILVVDDNPLHNELTAFVLRYDGYQVVTAKGATEALNCLRQQQIDLVVLDVMMPETDGYELCQQIRRYSDTPIIFVSAKGEGADRIHGLQLGADDYLAKPFEPAVLLARIQAIVRRSYGPRVPASEFDQSDAGTVSEIVSSPQTCCPYLGLKADPKSVGVEPSTAHRCYALMPRGKIDLEYQERFCLDTIYDRCPRYMQAAEPERTIRGVHVPGYAMAAAFITMAAIILVGAFYGLENSSVRAALSLYLPAPMVARLYAPRIATSSPETNQVLAASPTPLPASPTAVPTETGVPASLPKIDPTGSAATEITATVEIKPIEVHATATATLEPTPSFVPPTAEVTVRIALNVRGGPGTEHDIITHLLRGDTIDVLGQNENADWLNVRLIDGTVGWISREYTDFNGTVPVVAITATTTE